MVLIKEYRVMIPITLKEYQVAQLWQTAESSKEETGDGEGVEIIRNEPFEKEESMGGASGQYTFKLFHILNKLPGWVRKLIPGGESLQPQEEAWNAFPHCKTVLTVPFLGDAFEIVIESLHCMDRGTQENALDLSPELLKQREVIVIDIANDPFPEKDYKEEEDPAKFQSEKTGRGPLSPDWIKDYDGEVLCAYKLVTTKFAWFGLSGIMERFIQSLLQGVFHKFHRQLFCSQDQWHGVSMDDIRRMEAETKALLAERLGHVDDSVDMSGDDARSTDGMSEAELDDKERRLVTKVQHDPELLTDSKIAEERLRLSSGGESGEG